MRRRVPRALSIAVGELAAALEPATPLARVQRVWRDAVGEDVAQAARPVAERDGVLTIACSDAVWSAELQMLSPQLAKQLNAALGAPLIGSLRCRVG